MSNVIDLKRVKETRPTTKPKTEEFSFEEVLKHNKSNQQRLKQDRDRANGKVKRSYRLDK